jgi:Gpi18-like mannosyltransferase
VTLLAGSVLMQLVLGMLFGHAHDMPIFMATGYLVATGQNPYLAQDLSGLFHNSAFSGLTSIGYPPPWPLVLGGIYRLIGGAPPNLLGYNLAIKVPIIAANVALAFLVARLLIKEGVKPEVVRKAWIFLLWNPFILLASAAWGQFDSVVALLALAALALLDLKKVDLSAILLGLAIAAKPIALPLLPLPWMFMSHAPRRRRWRYYMLLAASLVFFCVVPFVIFGWSPEVIIRNWNAHLVVGGGMSLLTFRELTNGSYALDGAWQILGVVWLPAVAVAAWSIRSRVNQLRGLLAASTGLVLVFFLTRAWLSEPNILLVLPLVVILVSMGDLPSLGLAAIWILPLVFAVFNTSLVQLLFPSMPEAMGRLLDLPGTYRTAWLLARTVVVLPWQVVGWWIVVRCLRRPSREAT